LGCASGKAGAGPRNIFGNKYGQNLAAVQVAREKRIEAKEKLEEERRRREEEKRKNDDEDDKDDEETDDDEDGDDDYGPSPVAGIWAGSQKLQQESERIADLDDAGEEETDDEEEEERPSKKVRTEDED
jgi:hypothetical protein